MSSFPNSTCPVSTNWHKYNMIPVWSSFNLDVPMTLKQSGPSDLPLVARTLRLWVLVRVSSPVSTAHGWQVTRLITGGWDITLASSTWSSAAVWSELRWPTPLTSTWATPLERWVRLWPSGPASFCQMVNLIFLFVCFYFYFAGLCQDYPWGCQCCIEDLKFFLFVCLPVCANLTSRYLHVLYKAVIASLSLWECGPVKYYSCCCE